MKKIIKKWINQDILFDEFNYNNYNFKNLILNKELKENKYLIIDFDFTVLRQLNYHLDQKDFNKSEIIEWFKERKNEITNVIENIDRYNRKIQYFIVEKEKVAISKLKPNYKNKGASNAHE